MFSDMIKSPLFFNQFMFIILPHMLYVWHLAIHIFLWFCHHSILWNFGLLIHLIGIYLFVHNIKSCMPLIWYLHLFNLCPVALEVNLFSSLEDNSSDSIVVTSFPSSDSFCSTACVFSSSSSVPFWFFNLRFSSS